MSNQELTGSRFWPQALSDLQIGAGTAMQLEQTSSGQRFKSEWVGASLGQYIYLRAPQSASRLLPGTSLRVRMLQDNWVCGFTVALQAHISQPEGLWVLDYPATIEVARLREDRRLPVAIRVRIDGTDPLAGPKGVSALISDLHLQGASIESHMPLGNEGDQIFVTTRLAFAATEHLVMLAGKIVNCSEAHQASIYSYQYGVRFDSMDDETRVYLRGYLAEMRLNYLGYELG
ncbi:MAG TPA: PilZ domain-containing protein [Marinobacterium sp.]|nr:PilZ domain-containing protein [Marinobacterium sp.]